MEETLTAWMLGDAPLAALVASRINWDARPQAEGLPAVSLTLVSTMPTQTMTGPTSLESCRVQIDCWGTTSGSAVAVARAVRTRMEALVPGVAAPIEAAFTAGLIAFAPEDEGGGAMIYRRMIDFFVWYRR
ncbi:MAG: hypothetical protein RIS94_3278 [Pseudomonadota bacterium]|jgi:hypothetical protein